jgi:protein TonB
MRKTVNLIMVAIACFGALVPSGFTQETKQKFVHAPKLIRDAEAEYTPEARKAKLQGIVKLRCVVGANGKISEANVVQGLGMGLDESAVAAVKKYKFSPATLDKKPVPVLIMIEVPFELIN